MNEALGQPVRIGAIGVGTHATTSILPNLPAAWIVLAATCARPSRPSGGGAARFGAGSAFDEAGRMLDSVALDGVGVVVPPDQFVGVVRTSIRESATATVMLTSQIADRVLRA